MTDASGTQGPATQPLAEPGAGTRGPLREAPEAARERLWESLRQARKDPARHLGEALIERGLISPTQLSDLLARQAGAVPHRALGALLVDEGLLTQTQLDRVMGDWLGLRFVDLDQVLPAADALAAVPLEFAERETVLPLMLRDGALVVAVPDPWEHKDLIKQLHLLTGRVIVPVAGLPGALAPAIARAYRVQRAAAVAPARRNLEDLAEELAQHQEGNGTNDIAIAAESDSTMVQLINRLIAKAIELRASDIHIEAAEAPDNLKVRLRVDGELRDELELPARYSLPMVSRLKIMAELDISEHRKPQDGKIDFAHFGGPRIELRMVTVPTVHGLEDVVLRLLSGLKPMPLDGIDLSARHLEVLRDVILKSYGLILICGPTGSGKTTTLHSVLRELNNGTRKIWTAEDPVEITQHGLRQVQVNPRIGWTFAAAMRTFLRADPDVIMIGEMRDEETARIAIEASLTGHLVLSTLHTNTAAESVTRLLEIGIDPFMFSDSLLAVVGQRLVRRLCPACRAREPMPVGELEHLADLYCSSGPADVAALLARWRTRHADADGRVWQWRRVGCRHCEGSGYRGRVGIHELLVADEPLREAIRHRAPLREILDAAQRSGMTTLRQDGLEKVLLGVTDLAEVVAATNQ
jgi:type II secretory ATPase GspE/PulE/Tfp pilus assembly ATPase PilB-like protein